MTTQVLGEDLVLVTGQQRRLQRGGDTWSNPVSYDKLAVRYRRWRNEVGESAQPDATFYEGHAMNAGDLFSLDEGDFSPEVDLYADRQ
jgi:chlorophyllide a oxygenase